jgi:hypothetical protein
MTEAGASSQMADYQTGGPPGKSSGDLRTILASKRRTELRKLRSIREREGRSIASIVDALRNDGFPGFDGELLGMRVGFTFADYQNYGRTTGRHPSTIRPIDATKSEIKDYLNAFQCPRKAAARRRKRAEQKRREKDAADLDCRPSAILVLLSEKEMSVAQLMKALKGHKAFKMANGHPLTRNSLRQAVLRCVKKAPLASQVELRPQKEKHGRVMFWVRRRI